MGQCRLSGLGLPAQMFDAGRGRVGRGEGSGWQRAEESGRTRRGIAVVSRLCFMNALERGTWRAQSGDCGPCEFQPHVGHRAHLPEHTRRSAGLPCPKFLLSTRGAL